MKKTKDELLEQFKAIIGEDMSDSSIGFIEDLTDSFNDSETEDWKAKYEENDKNWRKKYTERFYGKVDEKEEEDYFDDKPKKLRYEDLFEEVK